MSNLDVITENHFGLLFRVDPDETRLYSIHCILYSLLTCPLPSIHPPVPPLIHSLLINVAWKLECTSDCRSQFILDKGLPAICINLTLFNIDIN